ncbi:hypothetical protein FMN50_03620 [Rhodobacterales bacterium]|nr:hypothetical protein FMN50_03620 [Rhodobacterales bacterium]
MTQDPVLFTTLEWVLMSMAGGFALVVFAFISRDDPRYPFSSSSQDLQRDDSRACSTEPDRK